MQKEDLVEKTKKNLQEPKMFKVILINDEITTMEFVIEVLVNIFNHSFESAQRIMLDVHFAGAGVCGVYSQEIALSKQKKAMELARNENYPLVIRVEEE